MEANEGKGECENFHVVQKTYLILHYLVLQILELNLLVLSFLAYKIKQETTERCLSFAMLNNDSLG